MYWDRSIQADRWTLYRLLRAVWSGSTLSDILCVSYACITALAVINAGVPNLDSSLVFFNRKCYTCNYLSCFRSFTGMWFGFIHHHQMATSSKAKLQIKANRIRIQIREIYNFTPFNNSWCMYLCPCCWTGLDIELIYILGSGTKSGCR